MTVVEAQVSVETPEVFKTVGVYGKGHRGFRRNDR